MSAASRVKRLQDRSSNLRRMTMSEFVFLYRGGESGRSPERIQQSMQKWMAWFKELGQNGHVKDQGQPLERTGKLVKRKRSEEHTSELQSRLHLVCRLLLEKKKKNKNI